MRDLTLRPYQDGMAAFAARTSACALWADMGLGKTATTLSVIVDSLLDRMDTRRWLVVAPRLVAADAWPRQLRMWRQFAPLSWRLITHEDLGLEASVVTEVGGEQVEVPLSRWKALPEASRPPALRRGGLTFGDRADKRATKRRLQALGEMVHLVSWDAFPWLAEAYGTNWPYDGVVFDEADFVANSTSHRHRAAWHVTQRTGAVSRQIQLTGMPMPNGYEQLHGQIRLLDGGLRLGKTKEEFQERWLVPDKIDRRRGFVQRWKLGQGCKEQIDGLLQDVAISLRREDYLSLPEQVVNTLWVSLPAAARRAYDEIEEELVLLLDNGTEILAPEAGTLVTKLRQIANGAVLDATGKAHEVHDAKLDALEEVNGATPGPVLLAYQYQSDWERIKARLGRQAVHVNAPRALDRFRAGEIKVMGMHPASGAHGIDGLQDVSSTAVWFGATYDARHWAQFCARLHRDGQRADRVMVHQILAEDTIEEYIAGKALLDKLEESDALLAAVRLRV